MNKVILMGRLTRDPEVRYSQGETPLAIARYSLAVDRKQSRNNPDGQTADFINCVAIGKNGEFAERYLRKGLKIAVVGHIQTGSYTNKDNVRVNTTEVVVEEHEFAESRSASGQNQTTPTQQVQNQMNAYTAPVQQQAYSQAPMQQNPLYGSEGFMNIPEDVDELPFN